MARKLYEITIDTIQNLDQKGNPIVFTQNDFNTAVLRVNLTHEGEKLDLTGHTVRWGVLKPDKTRVYQDATVTDATNGIVEVVVNSQALAASGKVRSEFEVKETSSGAVIVTDDFTFFVRESVLGDEGLESANDLPIIRQLETDLPQMQNEIGVLSGGLSDKAKVEYSFLNLLESGQITNIKLIGDSITVGVGASGAPDNTRQLIGSTGVYEASVTPRVWANFFREYINANYPSIGFFNAGIGGWSATSEGLTHGTNWYGTSNDTCFIMLGTNDRADASTEVQFETNIETFIKGVEATCNHLVVMTAPPTNNDFDSAGVKSPTLNLTMEQIDKVISRVCAKNGWKHISFYRRFLEYQMNNQISLDDLLETNGGSHPIASGYLLMWKILQQELGLIVNTHDWRTNLVDTKGMKAISESGSLFTTASTITDFRKNYVTYHAIGTTHPDVANFPEGKGGTLETVRPYSDSFAYQKYYIYQTGFIYTRYWVSGSWSSWIKSNRLESSSGSSITTSTPLSSFPKDSVTYHAISSSHTDIANFPFGLPGILKTVRTYNDAFSYQEYIVDDKGWSLKRYEYGASWRAWQLETQITGNTANRPTNPMTGMMYFDQSLGKPIWYQSGAWKDATGATV